MIIERKCRVYINFQGTLNYLFFYLVCSSFIDILFFLSIVLNQDFVCPQHYRLFFIYFVRLLTERRSV